MDIPELKAHLAADIVNVVDNLSLDLPVYAPSDEYSRKTALAAFCLESGTITSLVAESLSSGLKKALKTGLLTRAYISATISALRRWSKVGIFSKPELKTWDEFASAAASLHIQHVNHDHAVIAKEDVKQVCDHLDAFGSTVLRPHYSLYYSLDAIAAALTHAYGKPVYVDQPLDAFEPLDLPDHHELVEVGVFKLRIPILPAIIVSVDRPI